MSKKLFLLDGMALVYRAHFAFVQRPIISSQGVNTSALFGFTNYVLEILKNQQPTHLAVAFDTPAPTQRHRDFPEYKATREEMPEDLSLALPHVRRMLEAFRVPVLLKDGFEADDIIGTLVALAEQSGFTSYMVTPDKDFGQLVTANTFLYKPGRAGDPPEIMGVSEIKQRWGIERPEQVIEILGLMGDATDNIPGVPGIGEKTASKLIAQFGSIENLLARTNELKGKLQASVEGNREMALLSKKLATILRDAPCEHSLEDLKVQSPDDDAVKQLLIEFEFNSLGKRLYGDSFKAGRGFQVPSAIASPPPPAARAKSTAKTKSAPSGEAELDLFEASESVEVAPAETEMPPASILKAIGQTEHHYQIASAPEQRAALIRDLLARKSYCFDTETTGLDPQTAKLVGIAFSYAPHQGHYVPVPQTDKEAKDVLEEFRPVFEAEQIEKVGHNLKFDLSVLRWLGMPVRGKLFDTMVAHSLIEPDQRHGMDFLSERNLGYAPIPITALVGPEKGPQLNMAEVAVEKVAEYAAEDADVTWQLHEVFMPQIRHHGLDRVFYELEAPLIPVLVEMEAEGIRLDAQALAEFGEALAQEIATLEKTVHRLSGTPFNLNSPRQLGQVLFDLLKLPVIGRKTATGQYSTDEQTLATLAPDHEIVQRLLEYRTASKLKSTYADALPQAVSPRTGRVHTNFNQVVTATGRLNSQDPNLQNIPIRTERGQEIRKAFVPRGPGYQLLSADYSQIELRIIAGISRESGLLEAFRNGKDIHTETAARVFGVKADAVTAEMRRKAKMVNYGIAYGISAFGLSQRLRIPRKEGSEIIKQYFMQFPGIRQYMDDTIAFARKHGYVQTLMGRRRYLRDINSANQTVRGAAERNAINTPIQGTAADLIKMAMVHIQAELDHRKLRTRMVLQVHDELVFDLFGKEEAEVRTLVEDKMANALSVGAPIEVEIGVGGNWLAAH